MRLAQNKPRQTDLNIRPAKIHMPLRPGDLLVGSPSLHLRRFRFALGPRSR